MKYCSKCGKELFDEAVVCPGCGCPIEQPKTTNPKSSSSKAQTAFVLNIIALIVSIVAIAVASLFSMSGLEGETTSEKKFYFDVAEMKQDYEKAKSAEENFLLVNKDDPELKKFIEADTLSKIANLVKPNESNIELERLIERFSVGRENSKVVECIDLTIARAKAEKLFKEYENDYEGTTTALILFSILIAFVLIAFILSIITKRKIHSNSKNFVWIYFSFVMLEDVAYILFSLIYFAIIICGFGIFIPLAPILQTIAGVKFIQATKE